MSEYMIRTGFDRAFQISFNIIRMLKGCRDVVDTIRRFGGHGEWQVGDGLSQNQVAQGTFSGMETVALDVQKGPWKFESDPLVRSGACSGRGQGT
jgi:hypothetical protein